MGGCFGDWWGGLQVLRGPSCQRAMYERAVSESKGGPLDVFLRSSTPLFTLSKPGMWPDARMHHSDAVPSQRLPGADADPGRTE